ncbi:translocation and assembly module lipoprotein TamL [Flavobacterium agrisoli]|uniref:BamA/TamA family outer membrane protein n=1 Tax=Flavobacterium agrisoli TaxID=2793066 RepID=A0A934PPD6_9FLAO|nr:BamA/TamA family outer membrane protein [Flavobacterium agrisoli]MBK0370658.1 BamA/TamA family outer membrane protein [Flavobacterium agrisoli]
MRNSFTKIALFIITGVIISACNAIKRVPDGKNLLTKNTIIVNEKAVNNEDAFNQLYQKPNGKLLGYRLRLNLYNLANLNPDSTFQAKFDQNPGRYERMSKILSAKQVDRLGQSFLYSGINDFFKNTGEPPVIIDTTKINKSMLRLKSYYFNEGFFDVETDYAIDSTGVKKAKVDYKITTGSPYLIDSVRTTIYTPVLDSLLKTTRRQSFLVPGQQYKTTDFEEEKNRITTYFRNHGAYNFQSNYITFDIDTIDKGKKIDINLIISNYTYQDGDSTQTHPFKLYKISDVQVYTDYSPAYAKAAIKDSTNYNGVTLYSYEKLKYRPRAITDAIFINKGDYFADNNTILTSRYLNNLKIFNYPSIQYEVDKRDPTQHSLIAKIYLTPRKKFSFGTSLDFTHSNIQDFGIGMSLSQTIRNVFNGAETLQISARGNIGASKDFANPKNVFFNANEFGVDLSLNFPRILFPVKTEKIIPKSMIPSTSLSGGFSKQNNIGLDKENFTSTFTYNWTPKRNQTARLDLFNAQYVRNLNPDNYFNVYTSSYESLNDIAQFYNTDPANVDTDGNLIINSGTTNFTNEVLSNQTALSPNDKDYQTVESIEERRIRLSENDFILATNFTFTKTTKRNLQDNNFYVIKAKIESAGTLLSLFSKAANLKKNDNGNYEIFNLEYSEYIKTEFDYIKHWDFSRENVVAIRSFFGIAIPFGNADYIPFSRSYYSGGSNDNRAWQPYALGPGSTNAKNDFNEANMKIALSGEYRFKVLGDFKGAIFVDAGNIWNIADNVIDSEARFDNLKDLKEIAVGTGYGFRYDLSFFVIRLDLGFKLYNPANESGKRWFKDFNLGKSVLNFGINYPF